MYEDDFKKERSERENLNTQKERLKRELGEAKATIAGLQRQLKQVNTVKYHVFLLVVNELVLLATPIGG